MRKRLKKKLRKESLQKLIIDYEAIGLTVTGRMQSEPNIQYIRGTHSSRFSSKSPNFDEIEKRTLRMHSKVPTFANITDPILQMDGVWNLIEMDCGEIISMEKMK